MSFTCSSSSPSMSLASTSDASLVEARLIEGLDDEQVDRKSTRLNSSHGYISYAVFCLKKKKLSDYSVVVIALACLTLSRRQLNYCIFSDVLRAIVMRIGLHLFVSVVLITTLRILLVLY